MTTKYKFKPKGQCKYCGRVLVCANIPNRGPVMAHRYGERQACDRLRQFGRDMVSKSAKT